MCIRDSKGSSALRRGLFRAAVAELSVSQNRAAGVVLWDLKSFFDTIQPQFLSAEAMELGFSPRL
eukprot:7603099-Alexandrium_andersonii.AAC.1